MSVSLVFEYETVLKRSPNQLNLSPLEIDKFINGLCAIGNLRPIFYLWRPTAKDPDDDFLVDLAVECQADFVITYNQRDILDIKKFGVSILTPKQFLEK